MCTRNEPIIYDFKLDGVAAVDGKYTLLLNQVMFCCNLAWPHSLTRRPGPINLCPAVVPMPNSPSLTHLCFAAVFLKFLLIYGGRSASVAKSVFKLLDMMCHNSGCVCKHWAHNMELLVVSPDFYHGKRREKPSVCFLPPCVLPGFCFKITLGTFTCIYLHFPTNLATYWLMPGILHFTDLSLMCGVLPLLQFTLLLLCFKSILLHRSSLVCVTL